MPVNEVFAKGYGVVQTEEGQVFIMPESVKKILEFVHAHPDCSYDELAEFCDIKRQTVLVYVSRLKKAGLVDRKTVLMGVRVVQVFPLVALHMDFEIKRI